MAEVYLLSLPVSPFAMSVKMALLEKGVSYKTVEENYQTGKKSEKLLQTNTVTKQVPVLIHGGKSIIESLVILEYVEDVWKSQGTQLLPDNAYARAKVRFWANFCNTKFWEKALLIMKRVGDEQMEARDEVVEMIHLMDKEWSKPEYGKPFLLGDKLSLADLVLAPLASWKSAFESLGEFKFPDAQECPRMALWLEAIEKHPTVHAAIVPPEQTLESAIKFQNRLKETVRA